MERGLYNRDLDIVFPKEGSFSFDIRIFFSQSYRREAHIGNQR
jgi:hypothetical protein